MNIFAICFVACEMCAFIYLFPTKTNSIFDAIYFLKWKIHTYTKTEFFTSSIYEKKNDYVCVCVCVPFLLGNSLKLIVQHQMSKRFLFWAYTIVSLQRTEMLQLLRLFCGWFINGTWKFWSTRFQYWAGCMCSLCGSGWKMMKWNFEFIETPLYF